MSYFIDAFNNMSEADRESFYMTVFMNDPSEYAKKVRQEYYKKVLKHMGENVSIGVGVKIENPENVSIGDNALICDNVTIIARPGSYLTLGNNVVLKDRVYLDTECGEGYITVGDNVYIGTGTTLFGHRGLEIGNNVLMAQNITLTPYSHIFDDPEKIIAVQGGHTKKVVIGDDVYIGMGVDIMYTGDIGEGSIVGAGSVVVKPIPAYSVAVGNPARVIKERKLSNI